MSPERTFWLSQAGFLVGNIFIALGIGTRELALWELVFVGGLVVASGVFVVYAVHERERGVPDYFREWSGWQRLAQLGAVAVFVLGVLVLAYS
ncbi:MULTISPECIES: hypothetical protein [Haloferax]|uniref:Uncharacterized protein n=1 Tax=Haloferax marinum TaxID=2666143 RepID=A0A6A8G2V6_9EURY|nr:MULTISPECIES: hypothetical protein [Haloferax]KAB1196435.1 hypothetical protein Hfx1150_02435 [Haloferax sp. CBA1150]MRW95431.1 hypothetical protein [Haloferax marinum]